MRLLPSLLAGYLAVVGGGSGREQSQPKLEAGLTRPAIAEIDQALGFGLAEETLVFDPKLDSPRRHVTSNGRVVALPSGCRTAETPFDLLVHFHGAPTSVEPAFERSGIDGVLAILNLGIGSGRYDEAFQFAGAFDALLARTTAVVRELCPGSKGTVRRIALSAWSAGYGSVFRILERPESASRVDGVLLADGLHAGFEYGRSRERRPATVQMAPFVALADEAVAGKKLFALTHSSIGTPYASTTETADFILGEVNLERKAASLPSLRPGMAIRSRADSESFHVLGFDGVNEAAHCDHLHAFGDTLLPYLKQRWSSPASVR
jgi:hypothetical protein